jgi:hypothetical protein
LRIEIDCTNAGTFCLKIGANDVTIRGLVLNRAPTGYAIATDFFQQIQNAVIEGCFIGTSADGLSALPLAYGIILGSHKNARVGGTAASARNLIAGTGGNATQIEVGYAPNNGSVIQGNLICTNKTGLVPISLPALSGIMIYGGPGGGDTSNITIGGTSPGAGNVISCPVGFSLRLSSMVGVTVQGNKFGVDPSGTKAITGGNGTGIYLEGSGSNTNLIGGTAAGAANVFGGLSVAIAPFGGSGAVIQGNFIGTDASETRDLGNALQGIGAQGTNDLTIGGTGAGEANAILFNRGGGVRFFGGTGNTVRGNRIFGNLGAPGGGTPSIGIDLIQPPGPTPNDSDDSDTGGNDLQNFPLVTSAVPEGGGTRVIGTLTSTASSTFTLDFYANPICRGRPRAHLQADQYLGATNVSTNASGTVSFNVLLATPIVAGQPVTATATDANGSTSELSAEIVFSSSPDFGSAGGGKILTINGMLFSGTPTVTIGGVAATNVQLLSPTQVRATAPARPAGTVNDIVVTMAGGLSGRLRNGYVAHFADVFNSDTYEQAIARLVGSGITLGCGGGNYCGNNSITRAEMAIFLIRAKFGLCFTPPPATGTMFSDVPAGSFGARHVELLATLGVSTGCGGGKFCPNTLVTRDQMAVFLLRTLLGSSYVPPPAIGSFNDVPASHPFGKWIEALAKRGITGGCGGGNYCPGNANTRGEMAAFIVRTFGLP